MKGLQTGLRQYLACVMKELDIRNELEDAHASIEDYEALWGKNKGNNGFKVETCTDAGLLGRIQDLYPLVYQKPEMTNNSIAVCFACGILAEREGFTVSSTRFAEQV